MSIILFFISFFVFKCYTMNHCSLYYQMKLITNILSLALTMGVRLSFKRINLSSHQPPLIQLNANLDVAVNVFCRRD